VRRSNKAVTKSLNIKDQRTHEMARRLATLTGESLTEAVRVALQERLRRVEAKRDGRNLVDRLNEIARHCGSLPIRDTRTEDEILGYNERGMPE
jgi:antitoxin VapB